MQSVLQAIRFVLVEVVIMTIYFPIWWYTSGTVKLLRLLSNQAQDIVRSLNLRILAKYLFTPMYGLTDIWSRVISFPVRVVHFFVLTTMACMYLAALCVVLVIWLLAPVLVTYNVLYQLDIVTLNIYAWL